MFFQNVSTDGSTANDAHALKKFRLTPSDRELLHTLYLLSNLKAYVYRWPIVNDIANSLAINLSTLRCMTRPTSSFHNPYPQ